MIPALTPYVMDENSISRALQFLQKGSPVVALLHNEIVDRINTERVRLETAVGEEVIVCQQKIRAARDLLIFVHHPQPKPKPSHA